MASLGSQAHVRVRGERTALAEFTAPVENRAFAVWNAVRTGKAKVSGKPAKGPTNRGLQDVDGFEVEVNLTTKMRDLWNELAQSDKQSQNSFLSEVRSFLTASGNAVCVRQPGIGSGDHGQPLWWIRNEWNDVKGVPVWKALEPTATERRLTPEEAGETRSPAPVSVTNGTAPMPARERVLAFVRAANEPVYQQEIVRALRINNIDTGRLLRALTEEKQIYRRFETGNERPTDQNGRYRYLYWPDKKIPPRVTPQNSKGKAIDLVAGLASGEEITVSWMLQVDKDEIDEMVQAGLLEYNADKTAVRQTESTAAKVRAEAEARLKAVPPAQSAAKPAAKPAAAEAEREVSIPELSPETPEDTRVAFGGPTDTELKEAGRRIDARVTEISSVIESLIAQEVTARMRQLLEKAERDAALVSEYRARAERAESALIKAHAEASEARQLADRRGRQIRVLTELGEN